MRPPSYFVPFELAGRTSGSLQHHLKEDDKTVCVREAIPQLDKQFYWRYSFKHAPLLKSIDSQRVQRDFSLPTALLSVPLKP